MVEIKNHGFRPITIDLSDCISKTNSITIFQFLTFVNLSKVQKRFHPVT